MSRSGSCGSGMGLNHGGFEWLLLVGGLMSGRTGVGLLDFFFFFGFSVWLEIYWKLVGKKFALIPS